MCDLVDNVFYFQLKQVHWRNDRECHSCRIRKQNRVRKCSVAKSHPAEIVSGNTDNAAALLDLPHIPLAWPLFESRTFISFATFCDFIFYLRDCFLSHGAENGLGFSREIFTSV